MDNKEANSELGLASRKLAFALLSAVRKDWRNGAVDRLQEGLFEYGKALTLRLEEK